jgi:hypothetical protein
MSLMQGGMGYHAPHHLCECGEYAERNEYGELLCETCTMFTDRALSRRSKVLKITHEQETQDEARKARRIAGIRASKTPQARGVLYE